MYINPQTVLQALALIAWILKMGWIKDGIRLPLAPEFWQRFSHSILDDKKFVKAEAIELVEIVKEQFGWDWVFDAFIQILSFMKDFEWEITEEKWKGFWEPIVVSVEDGVLLWTEIGWILGTTIDWVKKQLKLKASEPV